MNVILIAVIILGVVGLVASIMLYAASKKFAVVEDERIGQVAEVLPQANCGGCGYPGCAGFAAACVKAADGGSLEGKLCPVGGQPVMEKVAGISGHRRDSVCIRLLRRRRLCGGVPVRCTVHQSGNRVA